MPRPQNSFNSLAGVATHYARPPVAPYGTRGVSHTFFTTSGFQQRLEAAFNELWNTCPNGRAEVITSAGTYVEKPGFHGLGRAFDLDAIFWRDKDFITLNYQSDKKFYLGVEAVMRKHFGTVLNHLYNADHRDHLHLDDGTEVGFSASSRSRVLFVQAAIVHVFDVAIDIDGVFGDQTEGAIRTVFQRLGISQSLNSSQGWLAFLTGVARTALGVASNAVHTPLTLLHDAFNIIDSQLDGNESRKPIETALNAFANHDETQAWLSRFEI